MTVVSAHQPMYLPWLGFFHKIAVSDVFLVMDDVQFEKNSFSNRNKIKGSNGDFWLTVPVALKGHTESYIKDTAIDNTQKWKKKHLKSIEESYRKAPYFDQYISFFRECYAQDWDKLVDLTTYMLKWFLKELNIKTDVQIMSEFNFDAKKSDLVLAICQEFDAHVYFSGALGKDYLDTEMFKDNDIHVMFQDYKHPEYEQLNKDFISHLSIIDVLFNHGPQTYDVLMKDNLTAHDIQVSS